MLITEALQQNSVGLNFSYIDNSANNIFNIVNNLVENKVPEIHSIKINGRKTAIKINVVAIIAKEICLEPL